MAININHQTDTICATGGTLNLPDFSGGGGSGGCLKLVADGNLISDGVCAGCSISGGDHNIVLGCCAGKGTLSGNYNILLGCNVGQVTGGCVNFIAGWCAAGGGRQLPCR